ncbi:MAG: hypothetical protein PQJ44_04115, partial [Sphaerochaetaceae bacterium]|nr:hypothetical protein [Sphaerochaetaceae bacterium]
MKNLFKVLASLVLLLMLVACGGEDTTTAATTETVDQAPVFAGVEDVTVYRGDEDFDLLEGITANDAEDGDLTESITVTSDSEFTVYSDEGDYTITVSVSDTTGNTVTESYVITLDLTEEQEKMFSDVADIQLDVDNLVLPSTGANGTQFYWVTDTPDVITRNGYVINPGLGCDPVTVTMS